MSDSASYQLLAVAHLEREYKAQPSACIALLIARYYRLLAENNGKNQQENRSHANFWLECYLQQRGFAKTMRWYLKEQLSCQDNLPTF